MATQIKSTFTIVIDGQCGVFTIQATGPDNIQVEPQTFSINLDLQQEETLNLLANKPREVILEKLESLGQALYHTLFVPDIAIAFGRAQQSVTNTQTGIRLRIQTQLPEIASLPWELMHDGRDFIALRSNFPIVRGMGDAVNTLRTDVDGPLKILYAWAEPKDLTPLENLNQSANQVKNLLAENKRIQFDILESATRETLSSALLNDYHILCFAGHGETNYICLEEDSRHEKVTAETLALELEGKPTRLVFLATCKGGGHTKDNLPGFAQTLAKRADVPSVVAMQYLVNNDEANLLTARYFEALAKFRPADSALAEARKAIYEEDRVVRDIFSPVLYLQTQSSHLFRSSRNWVAIGFGLLALMVFLALILQTLFFQPDREQIELAQEAARSEATARAVAVATGQAEAAARMIADADSLSRKLAISSLDFLNEGDIALALLVGVEAFHISPTFEAKNTLFTALRRNPILLSYIRPQDQLSKIVGLGPLGKTVVLQGTDHEDPLAETFWSIEPGYVLAEQGEINSIPDDTEVIGMSLDENLVVLRRNGGRYNLLDRSTGETNILFIEGLYQTLWTRVPAFSKDGRWLALGGCGRARDGICQEGEIGIWDYQTKTPVKIYLRGHRNYISALQFDESGDTLVSASVDYGDNRIQVMVWDVKSGKVIQEMDIQSGQSSPTLAISNNARIIVSYSYTGQINAWLVATGEPHLSILTHPGGVSEVVFSPDGKLLVSGGTEGSIILWSLINGEAIRELIGHPKRITNLLFSADGKTILSSDEAVIGLWSIEDETLATLLRGHTETLTNVGFSPIGDLLASADEDGSVIIWNTTSDVLFKEALEHIDVVNNVDFSPDSSTLAVSTGAWDNGLVFWDIASNSRLNNQFSDDFYRYHAEVAIAKFSPDGKYIITTDGSYPLYLWNVSTHKLVWELTPGNEYGAYFTAFEFSPDSSYLVVAENNQNRPDFLSIYYLSSRDVVRFEPENGVKQLIGIAFGGDPQKLFVATDLGFLSWDPISYTVRSFHLSDLIPVYGAVSVQDIAISNSGEFAALLMNSGGIVLWDMTYERLLDTPLLEPSGEKDIVSIDSNPNSGTLATGGYLQDPEWIRRDPFLALWDIDSTNWPKYACQIANRSLSLEEWRLYISSTIPYKDTCSELLRR